MIAQDLLRGTLKTIILNLLAEKKKMYGYEITQKVLEASNGKIKLTYGALYPALHKMEKEGLLSTENKEVGSRIRKYYCLTQKGKKAAKIKVEEYAFFADAMKKLIFSPGMNS